ncbi:MAG: tRNA (adenosine(37)-N6)-threonylcarbamoyltransferase complex transferase subunit TsaD [Clostridia bacterium]|nr:tRNA (adenosine(37)-N6)-threonylcarbamoyltransferase complex transferase subunit TsaD [Clostridia bacterium]
MDSNDLNRKDVYILGIESSCDETAVSVVKNGREVLSNEIASQADFHEQFGGVVPELASRMHIEAVYPCIVNGLKKANLSFRDIDAVAVTYGPGLVGALLVGLSAAKGVCEATGLPLIGVNHMHGHIAANYITHKDLEPPFICLCVSGGHSQIILVKDYLDFELLGTTRDDAAGEAIDKIARVIGLGYPGGPKMDKAAQGGNVTRYTFAKTHMNDTLDFSFSGIKTSALNQINKLKMQGEDIDICDFAASYQQHIANELVRNTIIAAKSKGIRKICIAGGVSANSFLRNELKKQGKKFDLYFPEMKYCTDNAAMIASIGYFEYVKGTRHGLDLNACPSLEL